MESEAKTILSFGEALWDLLPGGPQLGGAPLNLAYRLCSLGERGVLVTRLGHDEFGQVAMLRMAELGMDTAFVQWDHQRPTGKVEVHVDLRGNPDFTILPDAAYDGIEVNYELLELAQRADAICFGTVAQRTPRAAETLRRLLSACPGRPRFLDLNLRKDCYTWPTVVEAVAQSTILKLNQDEARRLAFGLELCRDRLAVFCEELLSRYPLTCCVVTLGEKGAYAADRSGARAYEPGYEVSVVDTCGSGDAFSAAFLQAHLRGKPLAECCRLGSLLGALVATQAGATEPITTEMIETFATSQRPRIVEPSLANWKG